MAKGEFQTKVYVLYEKDRIIHRKTFLIWQVPEADDTGSIIRLW